jgi:hypothetical protein
MSENEAMPVSSATITAGKLIPVWNLKRKEFSNAKKWYYAVWTENEEAKDEKCILLTKCGVAVARERAELNPEDLLDKPTFMSLFGGCVEGRVYEVENKLRKKFSRANKNYYAVWLSDHNGDDGQCYLFTEWQLNSANFRAARNPEDCPKKSAIVDLFD